MRAIDYHNIGLNVIPIQPGTKRPSPKFPLRTYLHRTVTEDEIKRWFGNGEMNIGIVLGARFDNLTVRDFDDVNAYRSWASEHQRLSRQLPTAKTSRGFHCYFTADTGDVRDVGNGASIVFCGDGELRHKGYSVAPESIHPTGAKYEWTIPPTDFPFVSDLRKAGLAPLGKGYFTHNKESPLASAPTGNWDGRDIPVRTAIEITQQRGRGERHIQIFRLACYLKATELRTATERQLKPVFSEWFRLALPRIGTKSFKLSWLDFLEAWPRANPPRTRIADIAQRCGGVGIDKLEALCRELQIIAGDAPFFLDCRTAGSVINKSHVTANTWLNRMCDEGILTLVRKGNHIAKRANEYRYESSAGWEALG